MGIVRRNKELEDYLELASLKFNLISDKEYRDIVRSWKESFDIKIRNRECDISEKATLKIYDLLPISCYLFSCPTLLFESGGADDRSTTYGYKVDGLSKIKKDLFNRNDVIIYSPQYGYTCAYNHEENSLYPIVYCEI